MGQKIAGSMSVGKLALQHTLGLNGVREQSRNVTPELTRDNVTLRDELQGRSIEEYTNDTFQPAIDKYNARQKRSDRKINVPYVEWHKNNGNLTQGKLTLAYECVIQIGEHESLGGAYYAASGEKREKFHAWYEKQYKGLLEDFEKRYPHLHVLYAAIHFDEKDGTPHMHLCFQPQAECTRGLGLQVSIGKALAQDGIQRAESRLEAEKEGFQMTRMYREFRHDFINKRIQQAGFELKEEIHGRKHEDKSYFKDMMLEGTQRLNEREAELNERESQVSDKEKSAERIMQKADLAITAAKVEKAEAIETVQQAAKVREQLDKEIEERKDRVQALDNKIKSKETVNKVADEIAEIYAGPGPHLTPPPMTESKKGFGKNAKQMVTMEHDAFTNVMKKAELSERLRMINKESIRLNEETIRAANTDARVQELQEENLNLRQDLQKARVEARQAERKQHEAERERDSALGYIQSQGMGPGYEHEKLKEERHIHHSR